MAVPKLTIRIPKFRWSDLVRILVLLVFAGAAAVLGGLFGAYMAVKDDLPSISELETMKSKLITTVYAADGRPIKEFAEERRIEVPFGDIPDILIKAIIATEDNRFFSHSGVDIRGILRALRDDLPRVVRGQRPQGASTITQQLARSLFLHPEVSLRRKLKEMFLAREIEKKYSKKRILEIYCNYFYLGDGGYGVGSAADVFFGKSVKDLSLEEAALIAGIFQRPGRYSPYENPKITLDRRNHVLNRLAEERYITKAQAEAAKLTPMKVLPLRQTSGEHAAYFLEEVRKYVEKNYGKEALKTGGLKVYTTLDPTLQGYAESALRKGLRDVENALDGWRPDKPNLLTAAPDVRKALVDRPQPDLEGQWLRTWGSSSLEPDEVYDAIVLAASGTEATVRVKGYTGRMTNKDIGWTRSGALSALMKRGDVVQARIRSVDEARREAAVSLDQHPVRNGGFLAIEPQTGQVKAMVGGYSFRASQFNRAMQAPRQTGSAIKPFLYTAAIENGFTPASLIVDEPTTFIDRWNGEPWSPRNYDRQYKGAVTVRLGLEESRNVVTAKLLDYISPQVGVDYCRRFGIVSPVYPYLSLSLGSFEITLGELVSGYSVFPNKGVRAKPYFISRVEDKDGNVLEETKPESEDVISPQTAYVMTYLMQGVVREGTGAAAAALNWPLAGKTGTTDKYSDAWFLGFSPTLCAGVWVGNDKQVPLGEKQTGAAAALPIWQDFFARVIADKRKAMPPATGAENESGPSPSEDFEVPPNLVFVDIDRKTGLLVTPACLYALREVFFPGTEPARFCTTADHLRILDYYSLQKASEEH
ncbi:MAG TPA: PBP1A family penicillin-binding protein [Terriglobales bacterium]|nr:PBP1A family penicillin-binding protein [Terriglobales bacterium]